MKKRYWVPALMLLGAGLFCYFFVYGYQFTGGLLCALGAVRFAFGLLNLCRRKIFSIIFSVCFCAGIILMIATGIWIGLNMGGSEQPQAEYAVVLGAGVNGTAPSQSLKERIDAALHYAQEYPNTVLILSGGQGKNESITEAQCMYEHLVDAGIDADRLWKEEQANTTNENLLFSMALIEEKTGAKPEKIAVISSEYHLLRASLIAKELGLEMLGYPAGTSNPLYFCNMFLREIFAIWNELL
ncbi:MAG: YdcF family protein [Ruminococcaceae bacterium]|nr:YdcF family protein [Oscillospiraceae bacterium]